MKIGKESMREKFFNVLRDVFCGKVKGIEGQSATVRLMQIKNKYYQHIEKHIEEELNNIVEKYPDFEEELYDKLYTFFHRYFTESGTITFASTPFHNNVYEKIYTNEKDVVFFWKTRDIYYIKTERVFRSMEFDYKDYHFYFDASNVEGKRGNEKRSVIFSLRRVEGNRIVFEVQYKEGNKDTNYNEILRELKRKGIYLTEEDLDEVFSLYSRQADIDFFLHKRPREFLKEQFNLWLYQYLSEDHEWDLERLNQFNLLRRVAFKIIHFIAQFEEELVKIWLKPRFVLNSNYVITLDRIANKEGGIEIISRILSHPNIQEQIQEWRELNILDENFKPEEILQEGSLNDRYKFLPIDTKYFKDLEIEILSLFDNLDEELDGWLIKSENFQALNTILPKFKGKVQTIYIDPPFNKEQDADYLYTVKYKDSTWATMLENRLSLAKDLLRDTGSIFVRCDYNGNWIVRPLMDEIFGRENFRNEIVVKRGKRTESRERSKFETVTESLFFYSLNKEKFTLNIPMRSKPTDEQKWTTMFFPEERGDPVRTFWGIVIKAPKGCHWQFSPERLESEISKGNIKIVCKKCGWEYTNTDVNATITECIKCGSKEFEALYLRREVPLNNDWTDILGYTYIVSKSTGFTTENSEILLKRVIESTSTEGDVIMDFFLGSGTTVAVAHKLGRRWIGIEVGDHFYTVILPRMKKVFAYDKSGISKEEDVKKRYNQKKAGGFLKYYELESFEDILKNFLRLHEENCLNLQEGCMYTVDGINFWLKADYIYALYRANLIKINSNEDKIDLNIRDIYPDKSIDLPETISNLLGSPILKITKGDFIILHNGESIHTNHININLIKPLLGV